MLTRIKANIRRNTEYIASATEQQSILQTGNLVMNLNEYSVTKNGCKIELTSKEFEIFKLLLQNPKKVHISRLRNKIEDNLRKPQYVITVWGIGYKLGE